MRNVPGPAPARRRARTSREPRGEADGPDPHAGLRLQRQSVALVAGVLRDPGERGGGDVEWFEAALVQGRPQLAVALGDDPGAARLVLELQGLAPWAGLPALRGR